MHFGVVHARAADGFLRGLKAQCQQRRSQVEQRGEGLGRLVRGAVLNGTENNGTTLLHVVRMVSLVALG